MTQMVEFDPKSFSTVGLLKCYSQIMDELKDRNVIRTRNNPSADYAEWLVSKKLGLKLEPNSSSGYDAVNTTGERVQIKSRRLDPSNNSRQLGVIRNLDGNEFDFLIGVVFDKDFNVKDAYKIPRNIISKFARFSKHQNGHILHLQGELLNTPSVDNITRILTGD
ncbi:MAG: hypothetical protein HYY22_03060 [Thaumarchaeota archaeon]|nr:hypothetical protein [Nitrososphaerota archaeon]